MSKITYANHKGSSQYWKWGLLTPFLHLDLILRCSRVSSEAICDYLSINYEGNADFTRILYELNDIIYIFNNQLRLILLPLTILIIISFLGSFFVSKWTYKMQFKDIRNVSSLLDTLIMHYGYKIVNQSKINIEYLHLPNVNFLFNFFRKSKYNPKFLTEMDILRIQFNGNTIIIEGMFYHVKRILWHLKKHNK